MLTATPKLRALAISLSSSVDRADDLVQETLLRAITKINSFQPETNMSAWLFTILRKLERVIRRMIPALPVTVGGRVVDI